MRAPPLRRQLLLLAAASLAWPRHLQAAPPLVLGVVPNVSARALAAQYQPLRSYLEGRLMQTVQLVTAPDFQSFHQRATDGQYGLFVTPANLGALALADDKARELGIFEPGIPALAVALRDRTHSALQALRGHHLALANPASLVALRGLAWLREQGLEEGRDFGVVRSSNEDSLIGRLNSGEVALALMSRGELQQISEARRDRLGVVTQFAQLPGFMAMVPASTPPDTAHDLHQALQDFLASPSSDGFRSTSQLRQLRELTRADRAQLAPYIEPTRRALAQAGR